MVIWKWSVCSMNPLSNNRLFTMVSTTQMQRSTTHHSAKKAKTDTKWLLPYTNWSVMLWVGFTLRLHIWNIVILEFARTSTIQLLQQFLYLISMHSAPFKSTFVRVLKFLQIKEGGPNFWWEPILEKVWITWSPLLYINFKSFKSPISWSFIRCQCILHGSEVLFSKSSNFYKLKSGVLIS